MRVRRPLLFLRPVGLKTSSSFHLACRKPVRVALSLAFQSCTAPCRRYKPDVGLGVTGPSPNREACTDVLYAIQVGPRWIALPGKYLLFLRSRAAAECRPAARRISRGRRLTKRTDSLHPQP